MNKLIIRNLQKTYPNGTKSLNDLKLEITNGMFGLLGPNGAGKSTLMRTIAALQTPDSGSIDFNGVDVIKHPLEIKKQLGYLPQEFGVYPGISAYVLLDHLAVLKGVTSKSERKEQVLSLLSQVNLYQQRNKAVHTFSGGMRQRFGIAQALLANPKIIIVDEPTAGLDPEERNRFNNLLSEIGEQIIVILSTHIVEDVRDLCTSMAIMISGAIVQTGDPAQLVDAMRGKIWQKTIQKNELTSIQEHQHVISTRLNAGKLSVHVYAESQPAQGFSAIEASLEDFYFNTLSNTQSKSFIHG